MMEGLNPILQSKIEFKSTQNVRLKAMPAQEPDKIEISNKKQEEPKSFLSVLGALALTAGIATGGIYGGKEIYKKYFQKLACGIKKGEINDALYNFIKNNDPKGTLFNNKAAVIELNNGLNDEKLIILKQLAKMKKHNIFTPKGKETKHRFTLQEIKSLLKETNEENIKYLEQLAQKTEKLSGDRENSFSSSEILRVLECINSGNEKIAKQLIDITEIRPTEIERLTECLKNTTQDNVDIWQILLSTRQKGGKTELNLASLSSLAKKVEETQNPKCAEVILNAEKKNGTGTYIYDIDDVLSILPKLKEENADIYRQFHELKSVSEIKSNKCASLLPAINQHNIGMVDTILSKTHAGSTQVIFSDYNNIKEVLEAINKDNKDLAEELLKLIKTKYCIAGRYSSTDKTLIEVLNKTRDTSQREKANNILNTNSIRDFDHFVSLFFKPDSAI
ncbi:MAG: hypothetical protein NC408_00860 [Candidatus Gastranaerophilales bacterium]|nr:hypothetical protein [Candidatus Gastranaerophilales bacterium]